MRNIEMGAGDARRAIEKQVEVQRTRGVAIGPLAAWCGLEGLQRTQPRIRSELCAALDFCVLDGRRRSDIALFVTEAASNAVRHAYGLPQEHQAENEP